jgi:hypothetical protein
MFPGIFFRREGDHDLEELFSGRQNLIYLYPLQAFIFFWKWGNRSPLPSGYVPDLDEDLLYYEELRYDMFNIKLSFHTTRQNHIHSISRQIWISQERAYTSDSLYQIKFYVKSFISQFLRVKEQNPYFLTYRSIRSLPRYIHLGFSCIY